MNKNLDWFYKIVEQVSEEEYIVDMFVRLKEPVQYIPLQFKILPDGVKFRE